MNNGDKVDAAASAANLAVSNGYPPIFVQSLLFDWMGMHSGYGLLGNRLAAEGATQFTARVSHVHEPPRGPIYRGLRKVKKAGLKVADRLLSTEQPIPANPYPTAVPPNLIQATGQVERELIRSVDHCNDALVHCLYAESMSGHFMMSQARKKCTWIGSIHQPRGWWRMFHGMPEMFERFDALIALGKEQADYLAEFIGPERVHFLRHPVDLEFFVPGARTVTEKLAKPRILFGGRWMRDTLTFASVAKELLARYPDLEIDALVKREDRFGAEFIGLGASGRVHWHEGISDDDLLKLLQNTTILLMPFLDAVANNGIIEAVSCGVPVVSTDVGDVDCYVEDAFGRCAAPGNVEEHLQGVLDFLDDEQAYREASKSARAFAENKLAMDVIFRKLQEIYGTVLAGQ